MRTMITDAVAAAERMNSHIQTERNHQIGQNDAAGFIADTQAMARILGPMAELLTAPLWLVWSNERNAWWGDQNCGYFTDIGSAGRYTFEAAQANCNKRSRRSDGLPCEVVIPSPEWIEARERLLSEQPKGSSA